MVYIEKHPQQLVWVSLWLIHQAEIAVIPTLQGIYFNYGLIMSNKTKKTGWHNPRNAFVIPPKRTDIENVEAERKVFCVEKRVGSTKDKGIN